MATDILLPLQTVLLKQDGDDDGDDGEKEEEDLIGPDLDDEGYPSVEEPSLEDVEDEEKLLEDWGEEGREDKDL